MAIKLVDETTLNSNLTSIANAIRSKTGGTSSIAFPTGFVSEIEGINSGGNSKENDIIAKTISGTYENSTLTSIGNYAFAYCSSLISVSFPMVVSVDSYAFAWCSKLSYAFFPELVSVKSYTFYSCSYLKNIYAPNVQQISNYAFYYTDLSSINMTKASIIGDNAFGWCRYIEEASFPLVTSVGVGAFSGNYSLTTINMPIVEYVGSSAFEGCSKLTSVNFSLISGVNDYIFSGCYSLKDVSFSNATRIGTSAFYRCSDLESINAPLITTVGNGAFLQCSKLSNITFPNVTTIYNNAFASCIVLSSINFLSVRIIFSNAFMGCTLLSTVIFSFSSTFAGNISNSAFANCYNLISLYLLATDSTGYRLSNVNAFNSTPISNYTTSTGGVYGSIFVPASLYNTYISASNWSVYSSRFVSLTDAQISNVLVSGTHL